jgi:hypothetical protein
MEDKKIINGNCWVACIDLLGFKEKVSEFDIDVDGALGVFIKNYYDGLINDLKRECEYYPNKIFSAWFSDTFLFIAHDDDSLDPFGCISGCTKWFCSSAMSRGWPLRAAIGFGQLYADKSNNIFVGSGLIDAYENTEKQNWIGAVITAKANERIRELGRYLKRSPSSYKRYNVPVKPKKIRNFENLFVIKICDAKEHIERIQKEVMCRNPEDYEEFYKIKYDNALKFFKKCPS